jgi:hypothetical protein
MPTIQFGPASEPAADRIITLPDASGTVALVGQSPVIVASFSAKGLTGAFGDGGAPVVLLASAPIGTYRISFSSGWDAQSNDAVVQCHYVADGMYGVPLADAESAASRLPTSFIGSDIQGCGNGASATFKTRSVADIGCWTEGYSGSDAYDLTVTLERLPDAPGALYYLNATADTSIDAGATVTPTPTGPTHASGTSVSVQATASSGYHFVAWTGDATGSTNPLVLTMDAAKAIVATFAAD